MLSYREMVLLEFIVSVLSVLADPPSDKCLACDPLYLILNRNLLMLRGRHYGPPIDDSRRLIRGAPRDLII
jgi:hypothetical protein